MPNRLSRFCDGVMEAGWLLAVIVTPLFFNTYSARSFEPDKATLLRSIAWFVLAAWLVKLMAEGGPRYERVQLQEGRLITSLLRLPLVAPAAALGALYLVGTLFSVSPHASLFGSYQRGQGTLTLFAYLILFAAAAANLRGRASLNRLFAVVSLTSLPIAVYGTLQRYGADPLPWGADVSGRVTANLGNAIFLAAYLIMAMPLAAAQAIGALRAIWREEENLVGHAIRAALYIFIFAIDAIAVWFSGSRGPLLGLVAGEFVFGLLALLLWKKPGLLWGWIGLHGLAAVFLVMLNVPNGPLEPLRASDTFLSRLGHIAEEQTEGTGAVRVYIAHIILDLMAPHAPLEFPDGSLDRWNLLRPLIGYGPESLYVSSSQFYDPRLAHVESRTAAPDRAHNETLDSLAITGLAGTLTYIALFTSVFYYGLTWLGLIRTRGQRWAMLGMTLGGGALGAAGLGLVRAEYVGIGLPLGMLGGLGLYLIASALRPASNDNAALEPTRTLALIALLAAVVAHFVELQFGIGIVATRTHFWLYAALMFGLGLAWPAQPSSASPAAGEAAQSSRRKQRAGRGASPPNVNLPAGAWIAAGILAVFGITLGFIFINNPLHSQSVMQIIHDGFLVRPAAGGERAPAYAVAGLLALVGLVGAAILNLEESGGRGVWERMALSLSVALAGSAVTWLILATRMAAIASVVPQSLEALLRSGDQIVGTLGLYYFLLACAGMALAAALARAAGLPAGRAAPAWLTYVAAPALALLAALFAVVINLRAIQADSYSKLGQQLENENQPALAVAFYQRAVDHDPGEDNYYLSLSRARVNYGVTLTDETQRDEYLRQTQTILALARELNPLNTDHSANLARLMRQWASTTSDQALRAQRLAEADHFYAQTLRLSPNSALLWNEWAALVCQLMNDPDRAQTLLDRSFAVDDVWEQTYQVQGELYVWRATHASDPVAQPDLYRRAIAAYEQGLALEDPGDLSNLYIDLASAQIGLKEYQPAVETYLKLADYLPETAPNRWEVYRAIAGLYQLLSDLPQARMYLLQALAVAPEEKKAELQTLLNNLP